MENLFVPYELAKLAKEKGFDERCFTYFGINKEISPVIENAITGGVKNTNLEGAIAAPMYQQLINWFDEKHKMDISIQYKSGFYWVEITSIKTGKYLTPFDKRSYRRNEALDLAIEEAFKLI